MRARPAAELYLQRCPKVELHVHLEGGLRPERLLAILQRHGAGSEFRRVEDLEHLYRHASFEEFLAHFRFAVTSLRDVQDVHDVSLDLFRDLVRQNVVYAEVIFSAAIFVRAGMPFEELLAAVSEAAGTAEAAAPGGAPPRFNLVLDLVRNFGAEFAFETVGRAAAAGSPRVVGIHLGGDEARFPARLFERAYAAAGEAGLGRAAHAGEAAGAASVRDAVERLGVTRLGHGIRCLEDASLVQDLVRRGTTLEVCPTSNVCTGVVASMAMHPLPELLRRGLAVTLGADDPSFFHTDLAREMESAHATLGLDLATLDRMTDAGAAAAFLPAARRDALRARLESERRACRRDVGLV